MMKRLIIGLIGLGVVGGVVFWATRPGGPTPPPSQPAAALSRDSVTVAPPSPPDDPGATKQSPSVPGSRTTVTESPVAPPTPVEPKMELPDPLRQTIELLLSRQTGLQQKRAMWAQLRQDGRLDQVITDLERRAAGDPTAPEYPTALGEAYLYKIDTVEDARDHAILGLKADQSFDAALKLDPANWEAGFYKTAALARWPDNLNKGAEVVQRFSDLIQLQETMAPRPEFAATYVLLGEQYLKAGQPDNARQVWVRGASLFPSSPSLQAKLAPGP